MKYIGAESPRREDRHLITGRGDYVADMRLPGMLEAAVLRSPLAHGTITRLDVSGALASPGVVDVLTAADLVGRVEPFTRPFYKRVAPRLVEATNVLMRPYHAQVLAAEKVFRVGEPVAVVVAENRYLAEDALEAIDVDYDLLPALTNAEAAIRDGAIQLHPEVPDNVHCSFDVDVGDVDRAFAEAEHSLATRIKIGRSVGSPLETRGALAVYSDATGELTLWATQPRPYLLRTYLSEMLHLPEDLVRVVSNDMGGNFGGGIYNEEILVPHLAMRLGRPIRWIEDRRENLVNARHSRDQTHNVEVCFDGNGVISGMRDRFLCDTGAYNPFGLTLPYNTAAHLRNEFKIDNFRAEGVCVLTNKRENTPVRGAGRTCATFVIDRVVDMVADRLGLDPVEVRRRNLIPAEEMPYDMGMLYRDGVDMVYDSGDYPAQLERVCETIGYDEFRATQEQMKAEDRSVGIGLSHHVEGSGYGPHEGAMVRIDRTGHVVVHTGANPHGQGLETVLAQICAETLGVRIEEVTVRSGDTGLIAHGAGTFASRSAVTAGSAVSGAAHRLRERVLAIAGEVLEAAPEDLVIEEGRIYPQGVPAAALTFVDVAEAAAPTLSSRLPEGAAHGLEETFYFVPATVTFSSGTHAAIVEVDRDTGQVKVLRYVVVDDCGLILNPMIVDGQQQGGVAHGIGNALLEEVVYDADGQVLNASFMDYLLPTASDIPSLEVEHVVYHSTLNPLGIKGAGEGAAVSPPAAIANAIVDALRPLEVEITEMPMTPERLWRLIRTAQEKDRQG